MDLDYTPREMMVAAAAREIRDGEGVFVGMRLPLLAFLVARSGHAPNAFGLFENGLIRDKAAETGFVTMGDPPNVHNALAATSMNDVMGLMQAGRVGLGLIGGAEMDVHGNMNTTWVGSGTDRIRMPGSGGAADIASLAGRLIMMMPHQRRRFVDRVGYVTSPGFGDGPGWRQRKGLPGGGPAAVITDRCVMRFDPLDCRAKLASLHPSQDFETVRKMTGFDLSPPPGNAVTPSPTARELELIRSFDPRGFWTG